MPETYKPEAPAHGHGVPAAGTPPYAHEEHEHSATSYIVIWVLLCILTGVTVLTGKQHYGDWALPIALVISTTKSLLVLIFFMHLKETKGAPRLIIAMSVVFALVLLFFTMADVTTRFVTLTPAGAPWGAKVHLPSEGENVVGPDLRGTPKQPKASPYDRGWETTGH